MTSVPGLLNVMLDRLFAAIVRGPSIDCKLSNSRQRLDFQELGALKDIEPFEVIQRLMSETGTARVHGQVKRPPPRTTPSGSTPTADGSQDGTELTADPTDTISPIDEPSPEHTAAEKAWKSQQSVVKKLRHIAEEARTYEEDTGVYVLNVGFPLLHLPKHTNGGGPRVLAPLAFIPVQLTVSGGAKPVVEITCRYSGEDRLVPNEALFAWIERQTGKSADELFADEEGTDPWRELIEITNHVCSALELEAPDWARHPDDPQESEHAAEALASAFIAAPRRDHGTAEREVCSCAVLGLFPVSNQGLLRDTQQMVASGDSSEPLTSFLSVDTSAPLAETEAENEVDRRRRQFTDERFVQLADPCQGRAVRMAREVRGLVIHGPPGTGKSQTIANIIGDHLARDQRVLFVCDKRTALDVVAHRLEHIGLGDLCALVHDAKRDQRDLYMGIRAQLENLAETYPEPRAESLIAKTDAQLQQLHNELLEVWRALMLDEETDTDSTVPDTERAGRVGSFHDLVGQWLSIGSAVELPSEDVLDVTESDLRESELGVEGVLQRGLDVDYVNNPWPDAAGIDLAAYLRLPADELRAHLASCLDAANDADRALRDDLHPFRPESDPSGQARERAELADELERVLSDTSAKARAHWAEAEVTALRTASNDLASVSPMAELLHNARQDAEIDIVLSGETLTPAELAADIGTLTDFQAIDPKWWSFLAFGTRKNAAAVVRRYGLPMDTAGVARVLQALRTRRAALIVRSTFEQLSIPIADPSPAALAVDFADNHAVVRLILNAEERGLNAVRHALAGHKEPEDVVASLRATLKRAEAIKRLVQAVCDAKLFSESWLKSCIAQLCAHEPVSPSIARFQDRFGSLEEVLRIESGITELPRTLGKAVRTLLEKGVDPSRGFASLHRAILEQRIAGRIANSRELQRLDGKRIEAAYARMGELQHEKLRLVQQAVASRWIQRQRDRLLVGTGSRLNSLGAQAKQRLLTRGRHAMRLRQVIKIGQSIEDGDPLFDLRPVWMASPETVAQIFPREPLFDVVIFDEASQCRLEEALPVLTRARRVVVAGDPKQLPPTRFFESAIVASEQREIESDQDLFEAQQGEVEDLLGASLNLEIEHAYLDVHYRSQNADLIGFSNEQFYGSRLQAIPGHPKNRTRFAPLQLVHAGGIYKDGSNPIEADRVVQVVHGLLRRADPPSIGIASFNVAQRDLIIDKLDEAAESDPDFARRLAVARERRGEGSFDGLFVKNLENVQGDERDHIVISTTYGPNEEGRFYQRFGPLIQAGGGRRLNVLVTRARQEVHLVTSIPAERYRSLSPVPEGRVPSGGWLLYAYLKYAEVLAELYEKAHQEREDARQAPVGTVRIAGTECPSRTSEALADSIAGAGPGSEVYWGNDGFCVDIALDHPTRPDDVTIGVQVDMTRFRRASDPVEWELFRTLILESQGWTLQRTWTPTVFRDLTGVRESVCRGVDEFLESDQDPDSIPTWSDSPRSA